MTKKGDNEGFVTITNKNIYDKLMKVESDNNEQHNQIIARLDRTNGNVKLSKWLGTTALMIGLMGLGWFFSHINK